MKVPFLLRMPEDLKVWCEEYAMTKGVTLTGFIVEILQTYRDSVLKEEKLCKKI